MPDAHSIGVIARQLTLLEHDSRNGPSFEQGELGASCCRRLLIGQGVQA